MHGSEGQLQIELSPSNPPMQEGEVLAIEQRAARIAARVGMNTVLHNKTEPAQGNEGI